MEKQTEEEKRDNWNGYQRYYYHENKEKMAMKSKKYYEENKEKRQDYSKKYNEANKEKLKAYREANKEKIKETAMKRKQTRVQCDVCNKEMNKASLLKHKRAAH